MAVARAVLSAISRFVSAMVMLNFGGQQTVSTSVQNFVRMTLRKRSFVCSIPPRLQVLRPPIQPNHRLVNPRARTDPAGWHDLAQCWREIRGPPCDRLAHWDNQHGVGHRRVRLGFLGYASSSPLSPTIFTVAPASSKCNGSSGTISAWLFRQTPMPALWRLPQFPFHQSDRSGQLLCDGHDILERVHRGG